MLIPGMSETMAQNIYQSGFSSFQAIADAPVEALQNVPGYDDTEKAQGLVDASKALVEKYKAEGTPIPTNPKLKTAVAAETGNAKKDAEARLQQELEQLNADSDTDAEATEETVAEEDAKVAEEVVAEEAEAETAGDTEEA